MRPLSLTIAGFRSYREPQTFDLADRRLLGVVGPIGSGKSSLLDAVSFALYGRTPTVARDTKGLINQRAEACQVELWFDVDGQSWRAVRALRRRGQSEHALYRHEEPSEASARLDVVTGERAVTEKVGELLGLGFAPFSRSVLLAQNQFAAFLKATPGDRDDVLRGVFGFDRIMAMQAIARERVSTAERDLAELERTRREVAADQAALVEAEAALQVAADRLARLDEVRPVLAGLVEEARQAADDRERAAARLAELDRIEIPDVAAAQLDEARAAEAGLATADAAVQSATAAVDRAAAKLAKVVERHGDRASLERALLSAQRLADRRQAARDAAGRAATAIKEAAAAATAAEKTATRVQAADEAVAEQQAALATTRAALQTAEDGFHAAQHQEMAAALRSGLAAGEPCPVCDQPVATVPRKRRPASLAAAEKARDAARRNVEKAQALVDKASAAAAEAGRAGAAAAQRAAGAADAAAAAQRQADELATQEAAAASDLEALAGPGQAERRVTEWQQQLDSAESALDGARSASLAAAAAGTEARRRRDAARTVMERVRRQVAGAAARLGAEMDTGDDPDALAAGLDKLRSVRQAELEGAREHEAKAATRLAEIAELRGAALAGVDIDADASFEEVHAAAGRAAAALGERVELLSARVARVAELEAQNEEAVARLDTYRTLAADLAPAKFLRYLLDEERAGLAALGGERFALLSGGRYRFTPDGDFRVIDLFAADAVRSADSLSGGETFLASLALALALAEMVTRGGGRLDAFFLDEGFGSLDAEHLDLAMDGIERLVSDDPNRLVVVVSHVPELRQRLEDLIVLDRDPLTGDTIVRES